MGLVTVALLTLAPLALRPVRLACLIHAANVHSEPGSNPSKVCRRDRPRKAPARRPPQRVEESDWSHRGESRRVDPADVRPAAGFESPPPPQPCRKPRGTAAPDGLSPAPLKGSQRTSRYCHDYDRPDCQRVDRPPPTLSAGATSPLRAESRSGRHARLDSSSVTRCGDESYLTDECSVAVIDTTTPGIFSPMVGRVDLVHAISRS